MISSFTKNNYNKSENHDKFCIKKYNYESEFCLDKITQKRGNAKFY